jgi:NADH dehydrogenase [ubiquinone] 1 alpha subcomplex assembly factor 1
MSRLHAALAGGALLLLVSSACAGPAYAAAKPTAAPAPAITRPMEKTLVSFNTAAEVRRWSTSSDAVMGGISTSAAEAAISGTLVFSGVVRLENNGGFATITGPAASSGGDDLSGYDSIALRVKGDGKTYQLWLYTSSNRRLVHVARFETTPDTWEEIVLPFDAFKPENGFGQAVRAAPLNAPVVLGYRLLISDKQKGPFRLDVDWIKAVS